MRKNRKECIKKMYYLEREVCEKIDREAEAADVPQSSIVRKILRKHVEEQETNERTTDTKCLQRTEA